MRRKTNPLLSRLAEIQGNGEPGATTQVQLNILDGGAADIDKRPDIQGPGTILFPSHYIITEDSVEFGAFAVKYPGCKLRARPFVRGIFERPALWFRRFIHSAPSIFLPSIPIFRSFRNLTSSVCR